MARKGQSSGVSVLYVQEVEDASSGMLSQHSVQCFCG